MARHPQQPSRRTVSFAGIAVLIVVLIVPFSMRLFEVVEAGHVKVATLFGEIVPEPYGEGLHFPVNPFYTFHDFDAREQTHMESAGVPSQDQLTTTVDISVQYRVMGPMAPQMLKETGSADRAKEVHLVPKVRSLLREQGKTIKRAEDFFLEETQVRLQTSLQLGLAEFLEPKGIEVQHVLIRDIALPPRLIAQIEQKKEAEQQAERQKAELMRFRTEQEQVVAAAEAERKAAEEEAQQRRVLADAQAYEIERINEAIASNPAYIQIQAIDALKAIAKDPAAKLYFLSSDSPMPLPLMHMGEALRTGSDD